MVGIRDSTLPASGTNWDTWGEGVDGEIRPLATAVSQVETFVPGGTDTQKMQAAFTHVQAEIAAGRIVPWIQLPPRTFNTGSTTFNVFTGLKIAGSGVDFGGKNLEHTPGTGKWQTSCGSGASSLFNATGTIYNFNVSGVAFHGNTSTSQIFRSTGNCYTCHFNNLTFYGVKNAFGNPSEKWLGTQVTFAGHWTCLTYSDTPFTLGGGDWNLWDGGMLNSNSPPSIDGNGKPIVHLSGVGKTNIGFLYLTAENDWEGLRIEGGSGDKWVSVYGGVYEGRDNTSNLATRPLINMISGTAIFYGPFIGQVSASDANVSGYVHQSGGRLVIHDPVQYRATTVGAAFPFLYQTGGTAKIADPMSAITGEQIRIRWSSGATQTAALPGNCLVQDVGNGIGTSLVKTGAIVNNDFAGYCVVGSKSVDVTNGEEYICTATNGTTTSTWVVVGTQT